MGAILSDLFKSIDYKSQLKNIGKKQTINQSDALMTIFSTYELFFKDVYKNVMLYSSDSTLINNINKAISQISNKNSNVNNFTFGQIVALIYKTNLLAGYDSIFKSNLKSSALIDFNTIVKLRNDFVHRQKSIDLKHLYFIFDQLEYCLLSSKFIERNENRATACNNCGYPLRRQWSYCPKCSLSISSTPEDSNDFYYQKIESMLLTKDNNSLSQLEYVGQNQMGMKEYLNPKDESILILIEDHDRPFLISKYPVTNEQYMKFCKQNNYNSPPESGINIGKYFSKMKKNPIVNVSWIDAISYCKWANLRLPTLEEWPIASKGVLENIRKSSTSDAKVNFINSVENNRFAFTSPVDHFSTSVSQYGVYDMVGNTWEWTMSRKNFKYAGVIGGSFENSLELILKNIIQYHNINIKSYNAGFRVGLSYVT